MRMLICVLSLLLSCSSSSQPEPRDAPPTSSTSGSQSTPTKPTSLSTSPAKPPSLQPQPGHSKEIKATAFSPDGAYIATCGEDQRIILWDTASGKQLRAFSVENPISQVSFSSDGSLVIASGLSAWDVKTGELRWSYEAVGSFYPSADGTLLATSGAEGTALVRTSDGKELRALRTPLPGLVEPAFSPDNKYIAIVVGENPTKDIAVFEVETGEQRWLLSGHTGGVNAIAFSADGKRLASASDDKTVRIWDLTTGKEKRALSGHRKKVERLAYHPKKALLASSSEDDTIRIWDEETGEEIKQRSGDAQQLLFSRDGVWLFARMFGDPGLLWGVDSDASRQLPGSYEPYALSPAGGSFASVHRIRAGDAEIYDTVTGALLQSLRSTLSPAYSVSFRADGQTLLVGAGAAVEWQIEDGKVSRLASGLGEIKAAAYQPGGSSAVLTGNESLAELAGGGLSLSGGGLYLWEKGAPVRKSNPTSYGNMLLVYSSDGAFFVVGEQSGVAPGSITIWSKEGKKLRSFPWAKKDGKWPFLGSLALSPDNQTLAVGGVEPNGIVRLFESESGKELDAWEVDGFRNLVDSVAYSPDGQYLVTSSHHLKLWEVSSKKEVYSMKLTARATVTFSPDGKLLAVGDEAGRLRLLDAKTGAELRELVGHRGPIRSLSFRPDGEYLASGSDDGTARLWRLDDRSSMSMLVSRDGEWLIYTDDGYFDASPGGAGLVAAVDGMRAYGIEQLALRNNRPDVILKRMGLGTPELIDYYHKRYLNRLKKAGLDEANLDSSFEDLPASKIEKVEVSGQSAMLSLLLEDKVGLASYQVYVNGVPIFEDAGKKSTGETAKPTEKITLTEGANQIEVSALNTRGQESLRAFSVVKGPAKLGKDLYFVGFGVSDYADEDIPDLKFAHKDAKELSDAFSKLKGYDNKFSKTYTNAEVTRESIQEVKAFLKKARPQDVVVLFIAGHGLYDRDDLATYYYVVHSTQIDLNEDGTPRLDASTAVSFAEIEGLLSGLESRQKLFLMDTCESGERDEGDAALTLADATSRALDARAIGVSSVVSEKVRPWLLERDRYIYQDLAKRTGAVIFSSSRGGEYSFESKRLENGLFTEALLSAQGKADADRDGVVSLDELRLYVIREVTAQSGELQHPTVDRDNRYLELSFLW